jgi:hypothetical protein
LGENGLVLFVGIQIEVALPDHVLGPHFAGFRIRGVDHDEIEVRIEVNKHHIRGLQDFIQHGSLALLGQLPLGDVVADLDDSCGAASLVPAQRLLAGHPNDAARARPLFQVTSPMSRMQQFRLRGRCCA